MFQWHPAKPQFEWSSIKDIKHTQEAIVAAQYFADFFVNQGEVLQSKKISFREMIAFPANEHSRGRMVSVSARRHGQARDRD